MGVLKGYKDDTSKVLVNGSTESMLTLNVLGQLWHSHWVQYGLRDSVHRGEGCFYSGTGGPGDRHDAGHDREELGSESTKSQGI
jgi:hypothetical protein